MSGFVVPGILVLRRVGDRRPIRGLGFKSTASGWLAFVSGLGLVFVLAGAALIFGVLIGELQVIGTHVSVALLLSLLAEIVIAFFYEVFPEELAFRGYLYSTLNTYLARWSALLVQVGLFVMAALTAVTLQQVLGLEARLGSSTGGITADYIILLTGFGLVLQLCRLVTGSLWTSIGFHLGFLALNPNIIGPNEQALIQVAETVPLTREFLVFFLGPIVVGSLLLLIVPYIRRRPVGWRERCADLPLD